MDKNFQDYEVERNSLIVGDFMLLTEEAKITVTASTTLQVGTVLGRTTAGKYKVSKKGATDGSEIPSAILCDTIITEVAGDINAFVYTTGEFNIDKIVADSSHALSDVKCKLHDKSIFLRKLI